MIGGRVQRLPPLAVGEERRDRAGSVTPSIDRTQNQPIDSDGNSEDLATRAIAKTGVSRGDRPTALAEWR
ncbi:MAG: hypothetical protein ACAF42_06380 [Limnothrix sp. BL-A-16]